MAGDWVKVHRAAREHPVFRDPWLWQLFCWCLFKANFREARFQGQVIPVGAFVTGRHAAADELTVSPSKWYRGIERLVELGCITTTPNSKWTTITVCNWRTYQCDNQPERTTDEQPADSQRTADEQPADTIEEFKNSRMEEGKKNSNTVCTEPVKTPASVPTAAGNEPAIMVFPCVGKGPTEWPLTADKVAEYGEAYPGVDVLRECRKALQWCRDNPTKRKTFRGMPAFLTRWLSNGQDRGGYRQGGGGLDLLSGLREAAGRFSDDIPGIP